MAKANKGNEQKEREARLAQLKKSQERAAEGTAAEAPKAEAPTDKPAPEQARVEMLELKKIRTEGTQLRRWLDPATVQRYAVPMKEGRAKDFPPLVVFFDGADYWLGDGHHRKAAAEKAGLKTFQSEIRQGGHREARLYAAGANAAHDTAGLPRSNADKRLAVKEMLHDWPQWAD